MLKKVGVIMSATSDRLRQLMAERNLKQVDILRLAEPFCNKYRIKLGKSDISQFLSGKVVPGQWKLTILGMALNVSEAWLMGLDAPKERYENALAPTVNWERKFREALEAKMSAIDYADWEAALIRPDDVYEALDTKKLSFDQACELADRFGISIDGDVLESEAPALEDNPEREAISKVFLSLTAENQQKLLDYAQLLLTAQQAGHGSRG